MAFRLALLGEPRLVANPDGKQPYHAGRMRGVLQLVAEKSGWGRRSLPKGHGLGVAFHFSHRGYFAEVAEAEVAGSGAVRVHKVWVAGDVGSTIINPSGAEQQVQGSVLDGLGSAMGQELTIDRGRAVQSNFHDYPLLRIQDAARIDTYVVDSNEAPGGVGEPATALVAPAVCNAIYTATGRRLRSLPLSRHRLA